MKAGAQGILNVALSALLGSMVACGETQAPAPPPQAAPESEYTEPSAEPAESSAAEAVPEANNEETRAAETPEDEAVIAESEEAPPVDTPADPIAAEVPPTARDAFAEALSLKDSDPNRALELFRVAADGSEAFYQAAFNAAALLARQGMWVEARRYYNRARTARSDFAAATQGLALVEAAVGNLAGAARLLERAIRDQPDATSLHALLAQTLAQMGRLDEAHRRAIDVLRRDERNAIAMLTLGLVYRRRDKIELSQLALEQAIAIDTTLGLAYNELGLVFLALDDKVKAVKAFEKAVEASPSVAAFQNNLGALRNEVGAFKSAITCLERATQLTPRVGEYYLNLGNALRGEQRYAEAAQAYEQALTRMRDKQRALYNLAILYLDNELPEVTTQARYKKSIDFFRKYLSVGVVAQEERARIDGHIKVAEKALRQEEKRRSRERSRKAGD